jgi:hypothetical protein
LSLGVILILSTGTIRTFILNFAGNIRTVKLNDACSILFLLRWTSIRLLAFLLIFHFLVNHIAFKFLKGFHFFNLVLSFHEVDDYHDLSSSEFIFIKVFGFFILSLDLLAF